MAARDRKEARDGLVPNFHDTGFPNWDVMKVWYETREVLCRGKTVLGRSRLSLHAVYDEPPTDASSSDSYDSDEILPLEPNVDELLSLVSHQVGR
jgi:hypothetical protein